MKTYIDLIILGLLLFSFLLTGCTGFSESTKGNILVRDSLALKGSCIITGKVIDRDTKEPIRDANIVVFSKPTGVVTDLYGQFQIIDILPGIYTIQVFCVGYSPKAFQDIEAKPNRFITLDIELEPRVVHPE
jgi:hypothetical protein